MGDLNSQKSNRENGEENIIGTYKSTEKEMKEGGN